MKSKKISIDFDWKKNVKLFGILSFYIFISIFSLFFLRKTGYIFRGDDLHFHIDRIENLAHLLKHHSLFSFITTYSYNNVGIAMDQFYPNLFIYPFAVLRLVIKNPVSAIYDGLMILNLMTCLVAHYSYMKFSGSTFKAFIFTNFYFFSTYRFIDMLTRFDLGELLAIAFVPLAFLGFYEVFFADVKEWPILAIGMSLILYSHLLSLVIVTFFFFIILILNFKKIKNILKSLKCLFLAVGLFFILAFGFIYNLLYTFHGNSIKTPAVTNLQQSAINPGNLFESSLSNSISGFGGQTYNVGFVAIIILLLILFKKNIVINHHKQVVIWTLVSLFISTNLFPWFLLQTTPFAIIQFPWRFLIIANFFISLLGVDVITPIFKLKKNKIFIWLLPIFLLLLNLSAVDQFIDQRQTLPVVNFTLKSTDSAAHAHQIKVNNSNYYRLTKLNNTSDYIPLDDKIARPADIEIFHRVINHRGILQNGHTIKFKRVISIPNGMKYKISESSGNYRISLPFYIYNKKNYVVKIDHHVVPLRLSKYKLANVKIFKNDREIQINYVPTTWQKIAISISVVGAIVVLVFAILKSVGRLIKY
ncbi:hypothetical protein [Pediococcus parvulus]|uniref:hypothetical protein n=1 Tax=Pediococcus parvulus TaxID=54062 RepID=UPI00070BF899|nr:hypothetical protein [Pediococcus parvulus]MCT3027859.1 hypothetical protein [Pediococcus parvulus]